ncbi:MAG: YceH family protein [Acidobacteriota bacterium]|nr:YceH family protein [Acidobacteriota bacterium]
MEPLDPVEIRVLGALLEKESTTPEYYPLSLNALVNACNQKSNRHPVVAYDEATVLSAIESMREKRFAAVIIGSGRVHKYAQRFSETLNSGRREMALLCTLMLRGPQTLGELRDRSERMHNFADLEEVESCLQRLAEWESGSLAVKLPRQPGHKEARYAQLLGGAVSAEEVSGEVERPPSGLEAEVAHLREEVRDLQRQFSDFRKQFE